MKERFKWKAEIVFEGTADQFNELAEGLAKFPVDIRVAEWAGRPRHFAGCMPLPIEKLLNKERLAGLTADKPQMQLKFIRDIAGGIRTAHVHLGDRVVLLEQESFREFMGQVAQELGERRALIVDDYVEAMSPITAIPIHIP